MRRCGSAARACRGIPMIQELRVITCCKMRLAEEFVSRIGIHLDMLVRGKREIGVRLQSIRGEHFMFSVTKKNPI